MNQRTRYISIILLAVFIVLGLVGCARVADLIGVISSEIVDPKADIDDYPMPGGWSGSRPPFANEREIFNSAMAGFSDVEYEPFLVASQTIGGGFNYTFIASSVPAGPDAETTTIRAHIFYPGANPAADPELREVWEVTPTEDGRFISSVLLFPVIEVGQWLENVFENTWSDITFELPIGFEAVDLSTIEPPPGQVYDFWLFHENQKTNIMLLYVDLQSGDPRDHTAEEYLDIVKGQLQSSARRDYEFAERLEHAFFAGKQYRVLRTTFTNKENPASGSGGQSSGSEVYFQDGYARKYGNAIVVFLAVYDSDTKDSVDTFFSSISQVMRRR